MLKTYFLASLHHCAKRIYYKQIPNSSKTLKSKNQQQIYSTIRWFCCY